MTDYEYEEKQRANQKESPFKDATMGKTTSDKEGGIWLLLKLKKKSFKR